MKLLLATDNRHKLEEITAILRDAGLDGLSLFTLADFPGLPEAPETQDSFEGNALQKARFAFARTGLPSLADDSGLEVDALGMAPGVRSKRFTPEATAEANNRHLLARLAGQTDRRARFRCALALVAPGVEGTVSGSCDGHIGESASGVGGFGYDPLFWPADQPGRSMAQLSPAEKNAISHRGRAFQQLPALMVRLGLRD